MYLAAACGMQFSVRIHGTIERPCNSLSKSCIGLTGLRTTRSRRVLGCGRTLVYDLIGSRQLSVVKAGRLTRVPVAAVDAFVSQHLTNTVSSRTGMPHEPPRTRSKRSSPVMAAGVGQVQLFDDASDR
jgi:excisionase family DNA binding protein